MIINILLKLELIMGFIIDFIILIVGFSKFNLVVFCLCKGFFEEFVIFIIIMLEFL